MNVCLTMHDHQCFLHVCFTIIIHSPKFDFDKALITVICVHHAVCIIKGRD